MTEKSETKQKQKFAKGTRRGGDSENTRRQ